MPRIFLELVQNIALLLSLCMAYSCLYACLRHGTCTQKIITGALFGLFCILGMMIPFNYGEGIIFDGRSIIISLAGLLGGLLPALVAAVLASAYRLALGGAGECMGVSVIAASAVIGVVFHYVRQKKSAPVTIRELYIFGMLVHLAMVLLALATLPQPQHMQVFKAILLPVMILYPVGTVLIAVLLLHEQSRADLQHALTTSEANYREIVEHANSIILRFDRQGRITFFNTFAQRFFGYSPAEILGKNIVGTIVPETDSAGRNLADMFVNLLHEPEKFINNENENMCRDGKRVWISWANRPVQDAKGNITEILSIGNDSTDRKHTDDLQQQSKTALQKSNKAYQALSACNEAVARATDEDALLREAVRIVQQDCGYLLVWIGYAEHNEGRTVRPMAQEGYEAGYLDTVRITWADTDRGRGPTGTAVRTGAFSVFNDVHADPLFAPWRDEAVRRGYCSVAGFPLRSGGEVFGALTVYAETPNAFAEEELQLMMKLADSLAYGIVSLRMNIQRKLAENALRESEERFRKMAEAVPIAIMIYQNDRWIYTNPAGEAISGYSAEELYTMQFWDFVHPDYKDLVRDRGRQRLQGRAVPLRYELTIMNKAGEMLWMDLTATFIEFNGAPAGIAAVIDITERKRVENALRESEERFRAIAENSPDALLTTDISGTIRYCNSAAEQMFGYAKDELIGTSTSRLLPEQLKAIDAARRSEYVLSGKSDFIGSTRESCAVRKDGTEFPIEFSVFSWKIDDNFSFGTITRDITQRKQAEEALRESEALIRSIFEADPTGVSLTVDRVFKKTNRRFSEITGYPEKELRGQSVRMLYADDDEFHRVGKELYQDLKQNGIGTIESRWRRKDGNIVDVLLSISPLNPRDWSAGITATAVDITERKRMEKALEKRLIALTRPLDEDTGIDFDDLFNLEEIQALQDKFARAAGVASIITHTDGTPITRPSNFCRLCSEIIRKTEKGLANCYASDAFIGRCNPDGPTIQACLSGGLWDAGASITVGGRHIANWLIGQVRNEAQDEARMRQYARKIGAEEETFIQAFYEVPSLSKEKFSEIAQALHTLAGQVSSIAYQNVQQARFIADLKRAEESLRESREELLNIINNSVDGIFLLDEQGMIIEWNPGCEKIAQLPKQKAVGQYIWDLYYDYLPADSKSPEAREAFKKTVFNQFTQTSIFSEYTIECPDGSLKIIQNSGFPIKTAKGYMRGIITRDITDMRHAGQEQLRLATAIEQADETVVITDKNGTILYVNPAFERITGYSREEAVGQNPRVLKSGRQNAAFYKELWATVSGGKTWKGHLINKKKDGSLFEEEATISPVKDLSGEISNYVAVKRDVTQQLQLEDQVRQAQKMEAIGTLAGGIAHDFNNILGGIMGYAELALGEPEISMRIKKYLGEVLNSAERAKNLVKQILTFSRQTEQEMKPVRPGLVIKEVCKLLRASLPATIELRQLFQDQEALIMGDPTQIYQIVMNLCTNAHHAMRDSGGILDIRLQQIDLTDDDLQQYPELQKGAHLKLTVSDTGCGISEQHLKKIFDPYFTTKELGEGTGLGLAVVDGIVKSHGGAIKASSTEGEGTTFEVLFPMLLVEDLPSHGVEAAAPLAHGSETILFVDDEAPLRTVAGQMLQQLGYRVVVASNANEALEKFLELQDSISLVITDKTMPRMSGFELARSIKGLRPDMPVVMCTGYGEARDMARAEDAGISEFVMKPLRRQALAETVRMVLDRRKP